MVIFTPSCPPANLSAYASVPLETSLRAAVLQDFNDGSFARFYKDTSQATVLTIYDRPDFQQLTNLEIRQRLDEEGVKDAFALINEQTASSHAVWWVTETEESNYWTQQYTEVVKVPPISYPDEPFVLWQVHLLTQDLPLSWVNWDIANTDITDEISNTFPYDPHDPQEPPFTLDVNFTEKVAADMFLPDAYVEATFDEIIWTDDPEPRKRFLPQPPSVVRLTEAAAQEAGLISRWAPWLRAEPKPGDQIKLQQGYDWYSPRWAPEDRKDSKPEFVKSVSCHTPDIANISSIVGRLQEHKPETAPIKQVAVS